MHCFCISCGTENAKSYWFPFQKQRQWFIFALKSPQIKLSFSYNQEMENCIKLHTFKCVFTCSLIHPVLLIRSHIANIPSTIKNPNQSFICARLYQVHCLLSLNYKTTTKKEIFITSNKITKSGIHYDWQNS